MPFKSDFTWGTASSAYQIEGAWRIDGKGPSIWDVFSNTPGKINHNETGNTACCHYDRYSEDIEMMSKLGIKAYRFSISWPRVFPKGDMTLNRKGLAFYDNLVDCCIEHNITPYITLYHWDLPQALQETGGWLNRDTCYAFAEYASFICRHFEARVKHFITINEPQIISYLGYYTGQHAPGLKLTVKDTLHVLHHLALAHGLAVRTMRKCAKSKVMIGFSSTGDLCYPSDNESYNIDAARKMSFETTKENWGFCHHIFCDAVILGKYPSVNGNFLEDALNDELFVSKDKRCTKKSYAHLDFVQEEDLEIMHQPIDFLAINIYNGHEVNYLGFLPKLPGQPRTSLKWPITPEVMNWGIRFMYGRYRLPIYISENGVSCNDKVYLDGKVHDLDRIDFLHRYISELEKAYDSGVKILGYFHWSFTDNFEWHSGYSDRFGLVYVDFGSQERIPKDSAYWYQQLIEKNAIPD